MNLVVLTLVYFGESHGCPEWQEDIARLELIVLLTQQGQFIVFVTPNTMAQQGAGMQTKAGTDPGLGKATAWFLSTRLWPDCQILQGVRHTQAGTIGVQYLREEGPKGIGFTEHGGG